MRGIFIAFDEAESPSDRFCVGCGYELLLTDNVITLGSVRLHSRRQCRLDFAQRVFRSVLDSVSREARSAWPGRGTMSISVETS
jgi:hypothetical protein